jgi:3-oxoacyl-[acyl-carrier-protein] synthase II
MRRRVVITGLGVVSPIGLGVERFWSALVGGLAGIRDITRFDTAGYAYSRGGEVPDFVFPDELCPAGGMPDLAVQFLLVAAREALREAGVDVDRINRDAAGVAISTNFGGVGSVDGFLAEWPEGPAAGTARFGEYDFQRGADSVADLQDLRGPRGVLSLSCSSGTAAIGYAAGLVRSGRADLMVTGGYDALTRFCWSGLSALRTMSKDAVRPFDKGRDGTIFSEGAGVLVLESLEHARARGARIHAEVAGYGFNNNAHHMTAPDGDGAGSSRVMRMALDDAGIEPDRVDHVNTHGTGTRHNDSAETAAIKTVLGDRAARVPITANKSSIGHMMGAAGAAEAIASVLTIRDGVIPPTINYREPDPECNLDCVPNVKRKAAVSTVISNSAGIGGCNAAVVLARLEA